MTAAKGAAKRPRHLAESTLTPPRTGEKPVELHVLEEEKKGEEAKNTEKYESDADQLAFFAAFVERCIYVTRSDFK